MKDWPTVLHTLLGSIIEKKDKVLDVGCGNKSYSIYGKCTTVDAWKNANPDILLDFEKNNLPFAKNTFDYIIMIDVIEHINKERGFTLIEECKKIVKNKLIIFTPLYWDDNTKHTNDPNLWCYGNEYNLHKSLWEVKDFKEFTIIEDKVFFLGYWQKR